MTADKPLPPDELAPRLAEVYLLVGPLYRRVLRKVELGQEIEGKVQKNVGKVQEKVGRAEERAGE